MKSLSMLLGALFMVAACSTSSSATTASPVRLTSPSPTANRADSKAVDLRVRLNLLFGEQVMVVAKQAAAAVGHNDEYPGYATLLTTNGDDIAEVMRSAFGDQGAAQFKAAWDIQNTLVANYTIGVVTHNAGKSDAAMSGLRNSFVPKFADVVGALTHLTADNYTPLLNRRVNAMKMVIDEEMAQSYAALYSDLHKAYADSLIADVITKQILILFADKFPGDVVNPASETRTSLNTILQEHAYLATMATDATTWGRAEDSAAALGALAGSRHALGIVLSDLLGSAAGTRVAELWGTADANLIAYVGAGDVNAASRLSNEFATQISTVVKGAADSTRDQVLATIKVIDDQRSKRSKQVADDDHAAAAATQPLADRIV